MDGIETYIILFVIVLLVAWLLTRNQRTSVGGEPYEEGQERPRYDSPDIEGRGSFGRDSSTIDDDATDMRPRVGGPRPGAGRDNPNIRGQGSFGKDKD